MKKKQEMIYNTPENVIGIDGVKNKMITQDVIYPCPDKFNPPTWNDLSQISQDEENMFQHRIWGLRNRKHLSLF